MYYNNKRLALSIFWAFLGVVLMVLSITEVLDSSLYSGLIDSMEDSRRGWGLHNRQASSTPLNVSNTYLSFFNQLCNL